MGPIIATEKLLERITAAKENFLQSPLKYLPAWLNADQLTIIRILCIFPIIFFLLEKKPLTAFWFFIFGAFLDLIDGPLARLRKNETEFGKFLDPFADKVLAGTTLLIIFVIQGPLFFPPFLFWLIIVLDFILTFLGLMGKVMSAQTGFKRRLGANLWGKWKFFLQTIGICLLLLGKPFLSQWFLWPSVILAIASIIGHLTFKNPEPL